ncbi:MAG: hypothetical protein AAGB46_18340, partial [Verrucomicrobiota bacterium]
DSLPAVLSEGGMGFFSEEMVEAAVKEVGEIHQEMLAAEMEGDYFAVREKAHYLSNTAMALGIKVLYVDSKALQKAADEEEMDDVKRLLPRLKDNFEEWRRTS